MNKPEVAKGGNRIPVDRTGTRDRQLIARVTDHDVQAFEELYRDYHPRLTRFLHNLVRSPQLLEEVLNDTMMVVWNRAETFSGKSKLSTWIFGIAYRTAMKAVRRQDLPMDDPQLESRPSEEPGPDSVLAHRRVQTILADALGSLSADHRAVVDLTYFHEFGYREIAEIMECPVDTVKTRMFYARRRLKAELEGELADWI